MNQTSPPLLRARGLTKVFGGLIAVDDVSLSVAEGEIVGLIGPNGAGKTTLFGLVSGFIAPDQGDVQFRGESIVGLRPHQICQRGLSRTFQIVQPFANLSVLDNVMVGAFARTDSEPEARAKALDVLERLGLADRPAAPARSLTLAQRKRLELARVLATQPSMILLDEVMAGLNPREVEAVVDLLRQLRADGITLLVIEHVMHAVLRLCDRVLVLHHGQQIADGAPEVIARDARVIEAYLGEEFALA